jgi:hypothetical protein
MRQKKNPKDLQRSGHEVKFYLNDSEFEEYGEFLRPFVGKYGPYAKAILFKHIREQKQQTTPQAANQ